MEPITGKVTHLKDDLLTFQINKDELNISRLSDFSDGKMPTASILFDDNRHISSDQRKKTYAILNDISKWTGDFNVEITKDDMKVKFILNSHYDEWFSLSDCSVSLARDFISYLIEFCIEWGIPLHAHPHHLTEDIDKYIYACLINRVCAITGEPHADIHHVTGFRIGMGGNRNKVNHAKLEVIPLNRYWHNRVHQEGEEQIFKTFKIYGIKIKAANLHKLGLKGEDVT